MELAFRDGVTTLRLVSGMVRIADYLVDAELGRGASGIVYHARRIDDGGSVALKVLWPTLVALPTFRDRLGSEADAMRRLAHPRCVAVYDVGQSGCDAWIAMEYVDGATLSAVLANAGSLTRAQACGVMTGALHGLEYAHTLGLLHRDFKPSNVLVDRNGESKLADFGLVVDRGVSEPTWSKVEGSPAYMSPEQVRGEQLDARSDVYSAGAVLYELLTGRPPYLADTPMGVLQAHVEAPLPSVAELPERVGDVVYRALSKHRAGRPPTAAAFAAELDDAAERDLGPGWLATASLAGLVVGSIGTALTQPGSRPKSRDARTTRARVTLIAGTVAAASTLAVVVGATIVRSPSSHPANHIPSFAPVSSSSSSIDPCLVGNWMLTTPTHGQPRIFSGGVGIVRSIRAVGFERYDYSRSQVFVGGRVEVTVRGLSSNMFRTHTNSEIPMPSTWSSHVVQTYPAGPNDEPQVVAQFGTPLPTTTNVRYQCHPGVIQEQLADGTRLSWKRV